jgi:ABC-type sugar transport system ATPase subunit
VAGIRLDGIRHRYPAGHVAIQEVDLTIDDGEFVVLVGPSGCGKSTLLRLIAGLETPTAGRVWIDGTDATATPPQHRDLAMVFQSYALYPHMTVRENLAYGLKVRRVAAAAAAERVASVASRLGIEALLDRRPAQLSGGERQRVALGRAMARQPRAFLLDEPLSNLDPGLRARARAELRLVHRDLKTTIVYVTHDQEEAMTLGSRVAVMRAGRIEQVAPALEVYRRPANTFVAGFLGSPAMNLLPAATLQRDAPEGAIGGIRPHDIVLGGGGPPNGHVVLVESRGHDCLVHVRLEAAGEPVLIAVVSAAQPPAVGTRVPLTYPASSIHLFDAQDGHRL